MDLRQRRAGLLDMFVETIAGAVRDHKLAPIGDVRQHATKSFHRRSE